MGNDPSSYWVSMVERAEAAREAFMNPPDWAVAVMYAADRIARLELRCDPDCISETEIKKAWLDSKRSWRARPRYHDFAAGYRAALAALGPRE
jgi:hypothetical protein